MNHLIKTTTKNLTSKEFYSDVLLQVDKIVSQNTYGKISFDFNNLRSISPLVIPNLFCLGIYLRSKGFTPQILVVPRLSDDDFDNISYFLSCSNFYKLNQDWGIFELPFGFRDELNKYSKILLFNFDYNTTQDTLTHQIWNKSKNFVDEIINNMNEYKIYENNLSIEPHKLNSIKEDFRNLILQPTIQLCHNSIERGKSCSFLSLSHIAAKNTALISVSDYGQGFYNSIYNKKDAIIKDETICEDMKTIILSLLEKAESQYEYRNLYSIVIGLIYRLHVDKKKSIYGLSNIANFFLENSGFMRIHSVDTQIIISNRYLRYLNANKIEQLPELLKQNIGYNFRKTCFFPGVHIELELNLSNISEGGN